jgi:hypothetical protein
LRHGLNAIQLCDTDVTEKTLQIAKMIYPDETNHLCFDQARIIAESSLLLARVRETRARIMDKDRAQDTFPELIALERYERRAASRRRRAIVMLQAFQNCERYLF